MNINKPVSTFEAFCGIIADCARTNGDFALLLTESVPECAELAAIPEDKIVMRDAPAHSALLHAAGLALSGAKPWVLGRSLELMGGSYAHIREAVAMPALPVRIAAMDGGLSSASDGSAKQLFSDLALARTIPGMHLFVPSDAVSLKGIIEEGGAPLYWHFMESCVVLRLSCLGDGGRVWEAELEELLGARRRRAPLCARIFQLSCPPSAAGIRSCRGCA